MSEESKPLPFWKIFVQGVECRPIETTVIRGASGLEHHALCIGIDEARKRLVFVSDDQDPRAAVLIRGDVQAALSSFHVIFARAIQVNLGRAGRELMEPVAFDKEALEDPMFIVNVLKGAIEIGLKPLTRLRSLGVLTFESVDKIDFGLHTFNRAIAQKLPKFEEERWKEKNAFLLKLLREYDPLAEDLRYGVCPIPLYDFSDKQFESMLEEQNAEVVQEILRQHDIFQYFFPSSDHLALGLIDRGISNKNALLTELRRLPKEGHPYGRSEITDARTLLKTIGELQERGLVVEGGLTIETSEKGTAVRQTVKFKPREGLVSKIINRFKIAIDLKNVFGVGQ